MGKRKKVSKPKLPKLTPRQSRFAKAFMKSRTLREAALAAGLSPKNPRQSGSQMLKQLQAKVPEMMDQHGLSVPSLIDNYLRPLLNATQTKFAQDEGEFTDFVDVEDNDIRERALDKAFRLHGAYAPRDGETPGGIGVKVIVLDVSRPQRGVIMADVGPGALPPPNGHKPSNNND